MEEVTHQAVPEEPAVEQEKVVDRVVSEHPLASAFRYIYEILKTAIGVLLIALIIRTVLVQPFIVDGSSMEPSFHNHEYILVEKSNLLFRTPTRGDVIVFRYPLNPSFNYIKRVIGVPGDRVVVSGGSVTIFNNDHPNGMLLSEHYLTSGQTTKVNGDTREYSWTVSDGQYFVMGDNRDHSDDSRSWGFVPKANILGKAWLDLYPPQEFGLVSRPQYQ